MKNYKNLEIGYNPFALMMGKIGHFMTLIALTIFFFVGV